MSHLISYGESKPQFEQEMIVTCVVARVASTESYFPGYCALIITFESYNRIRVIFDSCMSHLMFSIGAFNKLKDTLLTAALTSCPLGGKDGVGYSEIISDATSYILLSAFVFYYNHYSFLRHTSGFQQTHLTYN